MVEEQKVILITNILHQNGVVGNVVDEIRTILAANDLVEDKPSNDTDKETASQVNDVGYHTGVFPDYECMPPANSSCLELPCIDYVAKRWEVFEGLQTHIVHVRSIDKLTDDELDGIVNHMVGSQNPGCELNEKLKNYVNEIYYDEVIDRTSTSQALIKDVVTKFNESYDQYLF